MGSLKTITTLYLSKDVLRIVLIIDMDRLIFVALLLPFVVIPFAVHITVLHYSFLLMAFLPWMQMSLFVVYSLIVSNYISFSCVDSSSIRFRI